MQNYKYRDEIRRLHNEALSTGNTDDLCDFGSGLSSGLSIMLATFSKETARALLDGIEKGSDIIRNTNPAVPDDVQDAKDKIGSIFKK